MDLTVGVHVDLPDNMAKKCRSKAAYLNGNSVNGIDINCNKIRPKALLN